MLKNFKKRQEDILEIVIRHHIETAEPVGSRFVARRLRFSSATIRNVMADLEESGFIMHPHTSAGRIPTDKGYRYYIDSLMHIRGIGEDIVKMVEGEYHETTRSLDGVLELTTHLVSNLTNYVGITFHPQYEKVYLEGASHILEQPEFRDIRKLHNLLRCLEEKRAILNLLSDDLEEDGLKIHIGKENRFSDLNDCSVVTRGYKIKNRIAGRLGVIGPKRMIYEKVIPTVDFLADTVSIILSEFEI